MVARKREQLHDAYMFPKNWSEELEKVLNKNYQANCTKLEKDFEVFAFSFPNELLLCISLVDGKDNSIIPVTYKASFDLEEDKEPDKKTMDTLIDSASIFFDSYFNSQIDDEDLYSPVWLETDFMKLKFFYQVSRENIGLTLEADRLLAES